MKSEVEEAIKLATEILELAEDLPVPAEDFAASVTEKTESIMEWIEKHDHVTDAQLEALENMKTGMEAWY